MKKEMLKNKKVIIPLLLIIAILFVGIAAFLATSNSRNEKKLVEIKKEQMAEKEQLKDEKKELEADLEKELATAKTEEEKNAIKEKYESQISNVQNKIDKTQNEINKTEDKIETQKPSKPSSGTTKPESSKPSGSTTKPENTKPSKPSEPEKKKVWVVDKPAWDEVVDDTSKPIYDYRPTWWVKYKDGTIKTYYDEFEWYNTYLGNPKVSSYGTGEYEEVLVGYEKKTIHHPEEGHWEYQ